MQTVNSRIVIFSNWNKVNKKGTSMIKNRKKTAPPITHLTALFGVIIILKMFVVHDLFDRMTAIFETIRVTKVRVLTPFDEYPIFIPVK